MPLLSQAALGQLNPIRKKQPVQKLIQADTIKDKLEKRLLLSQKILNLCSTELELPIEGVIEALLI